MKRAILCTLIAAALLLSACTRASESTVRAPDAGAPLTLCLGAGPAALDPARTENGVGDVCRQSLCRPDRLPRRRRRQGRAHA